MLRRRDFALLWTGGLVSTAGDWVLRIALPYFVYAETGSTVATAAMIAAELAPHVLLGTIAGVFVDRWERRRVLVAGNLLQGAAVALLLLVAAGGPLWLVYVVAAAQSTVAAFTGPAESALLPSLVGPEELVPANALNALNNRIGRLVGVPLGGTLLALAGLDAVILVDCASFLAAAVLIGLVAAQPRARAAVTDAAEAARSAWSAFWSEWRAGLRLIREDRSVATIFFVLGLMTFGGTMLDPLYVAWVRDVLGGGPEIYAGLSLTHAIAGIVGTLVVGRFGANVAPHRLAGWASVVAGLSLGVNFNVGRLPVAFSLSTVTGVTSVASSVGVETIVQRGVRDEYRGRVYGALGMTGALLSLLGAGVGGVMGEIVGTVTMLNVAAALTAAAGLVVLRAFRDARPVR